MTMMEVWGLMIRNLGLMAILFLALFASISLVTASDSLSVENNATTKEDSPAISVSAQGIWKVSLGEKDIVMAVNQSAQSLFGQAKFEGDNPWNGAVAGSISANAVSLSLAAIEGDAPASIYISAILEGETMKGYFIRSDSNGKASQGDFSATMISPDTSGYSPVVLTTAPMPAVAKVEVSTEQTINSTAGEESQKPASAVSETRFKDVTKLAKGINPDILPRMAPL
jgi:hypothetical protein